VKKILLILGHPDKDSLCGGLADEYQAGAKDAGCVLERLNVSDLDFDPVLHKGYKVIQELEPDLKRAQELILWSEHMVFVYPTWWATMPALFKGFIDRVFLPSFAFKYHDDDPWWERLLDGRSARMITTMDAPKLYFWIAYRGAGHNAMKRATLYFCGIKPVGITTFDRVGSSTPEQREKWRAKVRGLGKQGA